MSEPALSIAPDRSSFDGRSERVILKIRAWEAGEIPAGGLVRLSAPVGQFIGGSDLILIDGLVTATYACSSLEEPACVGAIRITAEWAGRFATTQVVGVELNPPAPVTWEVVPTGLTAELLALEAAADGTAWAVGARGAVAHLVGRKWTRVTSGVSSTLRAIAMSADGPVVVGDDGVLLQWRGDHFQLVVQQPGEDFVSVAIDALGHVHVGAQSGLVFALHGNELGAELDLRAPVRSLVSQNGELWVLGSQVIARYSAGQWLGVPAPMQGVIHFAHEGVNGLWLGGERQGVSSVDGLLVQGPMPTWRTTVIDEPLSAIAEVPSVAERFALSPTHLFRQLDDASWTAVDCPSPANAIASRGPGDLVLVGPPGISLLRKP